MGYPPFEQASKSDKWFKPLIKGNVDKFWKAHAKSPIIKQNMKAKDLLTKMLCFDPKQRIDLAVSININKPIPGIEKAVLPTYPEEQEEGVMGETYTYRANDKQKWYDLLNLIQEQVEDKNVGGTAKFNFETGVLSCTMNVAGGAAEEKEQAKNEIGFDVQMFASRKFNGEAYNKAVEMFDLDEAEDAAAADKDVYVVRVSRTAGDALTFNKIKTTFLLQTCSIYLKGLPKWAEKLDDALAAEKEKVKADEEENKEAEAEDVDDYDKVLAAEQPKAQAVAVN